MRESIARPFFRAFCNKRISPSSKRLALEALEGRAMLVGEVEVDAVLFGDPFEGSDFTLRATITNAAGKTLALQWDLDGGGTSYGISGDIDTGPAREFTTNNPTDWEVTLPWDLFAGLGVPDSHNLDGVAVFARVLEGATVLDEDDTSPQPIINVMPFFEPDVDANQTAGSGCSGGPVVLAGSFTELGINDDVTIRINWGVIGEDPELVQFADVDNETLSFSIPHTYASPGTYHVTWEVWDDEGTEFNVGPEQMGFKDVTVTGGATGPSVCLDGTVLTVTGSGGNDTVTITQPNGQVHVEASFLTSPADFTATSVGSVLVQLGAGNDTLLVTANKPVVAVGGDGADVLWGGPARSILIGGNGSDLLVGGSAQDILVDGRTTLDANAVALLAMLAEWNSGHSYSVRVNNLLNGTGSNDGLNGGFFLQHAADDLAVDILVGSGGTDWIRLHSGDLNLGLFDFVL